MVNLSLFPNLIFVGNQLLVVEPVAVDRTRLHLHLVLADGASEEVNLLRLRVDEDFVSFGTPDDLAMFERIQDGLSIPEVPWIDMSRGLGSRRATARARTGCRPGRSRRRRRSGRTSPSTAGCSPAAPRKAADAG